MSDARETNQEGHACHGPGYASPEEAMRADPEKTLYTVALYVGTDVQEPDSRAYACKTSCATSRLRKGPLEQARVVEHKAVGVHRQVGGEPADEAQEAV